MPRPIQSQWVYFQQHGIGTSIPDQLDIIYFGGSSYNRYITPSIMAIKQPVQFIGKRATELRLGTIFYFASLSQQHLVCPVELYRGDICQSEKLR